jgi:4-hydroxy-4-methyl-2-oxoglutarate aldolase
MMHCLRTLYVLLAIAGCSVSTFGQKALSDEDLIKLFTGLRVADISDGMDMVGLKDAGLMDPEITALWKDIDHFKHQFVGIALTVRYVPTNKPYTEWVKKDEYIKWRDLWYTHISGEPFIESIKKGTIVVIDNQGDGDTGSVGSNNSLLWTKKGAAAIVASGGIRDTDEIIKQKIPTYFNFMKRGRGIRPGRNQLESFNKPIVVGGVLVNPGDVVVGDGDGVIVIPRDKAEAVALAARNELNIDKASRKKLYEELGIPLDDTVLEKKN